MRAIALAVFAVTSHAQALGPASGRVPAAASQAAENTPQSDAPTTACIELKSKIREVEALTITNGAAGGDRFHARIPRCEFWQRPQFAYVVASDGWCGVGYVCAGRPQP